MFDRWPGAVLLNPPGWDEPDPPDLGDWEPIPQGVWDELSDLIPYRAADGDIAFLDKPVDEALRLPVGAHTLPLLEQTPIPEMSAEAKAWALRRAGDLISYIEAFRAELIAALAGPKPADPGEDWGAYDVAVATKTSIYAADRKIAVARALTGRLSATREAMQAGRITEAQARSLCEQTAHLDDDLAEKIQQRMLKYSHRQDLPKFNAALRRWSVAARV